MSIASALTVDPAAKAMTLTSVRGSSLRSVAERRPSDHDGFTLIELLVVVAMVAIATALVSLALPDSSATQLERESVRLIALLESARAEARTSGLAVQWIPADSQGGGADAAQFRFQGLPPGIAMPTRWLGQAPSVEIQGARAVTLGPEPMIGVQRVKLSRDKHSLSLTTDGLGPFVISAEPQP
jgi:general secretion pathway protein H